MDLNRFHDLVCAEAETLAALGDGDALGVRKAKALGVIAAQQASLDLTGLVSTEAAGGATGEQRASIRGTALDRRAAKIKLYLHANLADLLDMSDCPGADGPVRVEQLGSMTLRSIKDWVGHTRVTVTPVLYPHSLTSDACALVTDAHDPPPRMAEAVRLRDTQCVFPWCNHTSRAADLDHIEPYVPPDEGGPPGQPGTAVPTTSPGQDRQTLELPPHRRWRLLVDLTARTHIPRHAPRHPRALTIAGAVGLSAGSCSGPALAVVADQPRTPKDVVDDDVERPRGVDHDTIARDVLPGPVQSDDEVPLGRP